MRTNSLFTLLTLVGGLLVSFSNMPKSNAQTTQEVCDADCQRIRNEKAQIELNRLKDEEAHPGCTAAKTAYEAARNSKPADSLYKTAKACIDSEEDAGGDSIGEDPDDPNDGNVTARDANGCEKFLSVSCKALNGGKSQEAKGEKESAQDRKDKADETVGTLEEEMSKLQQDLKDKQESITNDVEEASQKLEQDNQDLSNAVEDGLAKAGEDMQKVKEEVDKASAEFDKQYVQMRAQFRQSDTDNIMAIDSVEGECRKQADAQHDKVEAKIDQILKDQYSQPRNHDPQSLAGSSNRVDTKVKAKLKAAYDDTYARCMKTSQKKLEAIQKNKDNQLKLLQDQAALIENQRQKMFEQLVQRSQASEQQKQKIQDRAKQQADRLQKNFQSLVSKKQREYQTATEKYQSDVMVKQKKMMQAYQKQSTASMELASAGTRYNCAEKFGMPEAGANSAMERYSKAYTALQTYNSTCATYSLCPSSGKLDCSAEGKPKEETTAPVQAPPSAPPTVAVPGTTKQ